MPRMPCLSPVNWSTLHSNSQSCDEKYLQHKQSLAGMLYGTPRKCGRSLEWPCDSNDVVGWCTCIWLPKMLPPNSLACCSIQPNDSVEMLCIQILTPIPQSTIVGIHWGIYSDLICRTATKKYKDRMHDARWYRHIDRSWGGVIFLRS